MFTALPGCSFLDAYWGAGSFFVVCLFWIEKGCHIRTKVPATQLSIGRKYGVRSGIFSLIRLAVSESIWASLNYHLEGSTVTLQETDSTS